MDHKQRKNAYEINHCEQNVCNGFILNAKWLQSPEMQVWTNDYLRGTGMEMYTETLSPSFIGMPFAQATE